MGGPQWRAHQVQHPPWARGHRRAANFFILGSALAEEVLNVAEDLCALRSVEFQYMAHKDTG